MDDEFEVFVPGRLCILGEHTDWAAKYRSNNPFITVGTTIVCSTNEGLHAKCRRQNTSKILFDSTSYSGTKCTKECDIDISILKESALKGDFFSYVSGTVAALLEYESIQTKLDDFLTHGIYIDNYLTTLPMKKGLSSSAAVCVLVSTCINTVYQLQLHRDDIMEIAYRGETYTPSRCGRMDQCVAMGSGSIGVMEFNQENCQLSLLACYSPLYFIVADLHAGKDTVTILKDLSHCFPYPTNTIQNLMHHYVTESRTISLLTIQAIETGNISFLAQCINKAQVLFDTCAMPNCISQLTSPKLHKVMNDTQMKKYSLAMKGVGSQGDGSIQILCHSTDDQDKILDILKSLDCEGFKLTIPASLPDPKCDKYLLSNYRLKNAIVLLNEESYDNYQLMENNTNLEIPPQLFYLLQDLIANDIDNITVYLPSNLSYLISLYQHEIQEKSIISDSSTTSFVYKEEVMETILSKTRFTTTTTATATNTATDTTTATAISDEIISDITTDITTSDEYTLIIHEDIYRTYHESDDNDINHSNHSISGSVYSYISKFRRHLATCAISTTHKAPERHYFVVHRSIVDNVNSSSKSPNNQLVTIDSSQIQLISDYANKEIQDNHTNNKHNYDGIMIIPTTAIQSYLSLYSTYKAHDSNKTTHTYSDHCISTLLKYIQVHTSSTGHDKTSSFTYGTSHK